MKFLAVPLLLLPVGCISGYMGSARDLDAKELAAPGWKTVPGVPVIKQAREDDCGGAAMTMVLNYWQDEVKLDEVVADCMARQAAIPDTEKTRAGVGLMAGVLKEYAIKRGMLAFLFPGTFDDFPDLLGKGRPPIVGMVKPHLQGRLCHYEVVIGCNPERKEIATIDPAHGLRVNSYDGFLLEWQASGRLILLVARGENR